MRTIKYNVKDLSNDLEEALATLSEISELLKDLLNQRVTQIQINVNGYESFNSETRLVVKLEPVERNESEEEKGS